MEEFIDQTKTLVGALGCDLFKVVSGEMAGQGKTANQSPAWAANVVFEFRGQGFLGHMSITPSSEFVVQKGSRARLKTTSTIPKGTTALRADLIAGGILIERDEALILASDYMFSSVSAAAAVMIGARANGRILWRLADGRTYAEWEEEQNLGFPTGLGDQVAANR